MEEKIIGVGGVGFCMSNKFNNKDGQDIQDDRM